MIDCAMAALTHANTPIAKDEIISYLSSHVQRFRTSSVRCTCVSGFVRLSEFVVFIGDRELSDERIDLCCVPITMKLARSFQTGKTSSPSPCRIINVHLNVLDKV
jgi:hypothetical protein